MDGRMREGIKWDGRPGGKNDRKDGGLEMPRGGDRKWMGNEGRRNPREATVGFPFP